MKKIIININGGIGRCIAFTGVLKKYLQKNPKIQVNLLTGFKDIFIGFLDKKKYPNFNRIYGFDHDYLFEDVIKNMDYIEPEPYKMPEYYRDHKHIINCFNIIMNNEDEFIKPIIELTSIEKEQAKKFVESRKKPVILFQPFGSTGGKNNNSDPSFRSLKYDFAYKLAKKLNQKNEVIIIKSGDQSLGNEKDNFTSLNNPIRQVIALIPYVKSCIGIDSFLQHSCAAFSKPCFVFWTSTLESNLGYEVNHNIRNDKDFIWSPVRIFGNDPSVLINNDDINLFEEKYLKNVEDWINAQGIKEKNKKFKRIRKNCEEKKCGDD